MKFRLICILAAMLLGAQAPSLFAQQKPEEVDIYEQIELEADRLQRVLELEDWQVFYVDSTLKHDYPAMQAEVQKLAEAKSQKSAQKNTDDVDNGTQSCHNLLVLQQQKTV